MNIFIIIFILHTFAEIIDLDEPKLNHSAISTVFITNITDSLLISIWNSNLNTIIHINNTNTTIIPSFLNVPVDSLNNYKYFEIENYAEYMRLSQTIPLSPCITNTQDGSAWVRRSSRVILESMLDVSLGGHFAFGINVNQIVQYTLRHRPIFKIFKSRFIETIMGCSTNKPGYSARLFAYIPVINNKLRVRALVYDKSQGITRDEEFLEVDPIRVLSNGILKTLCKVGTSDELKCQENSGKFIDEYNNQFTFDVV